jgi:AcrR family transcriptional regulator
MPETKAPTLRARVRAEMTAEIKRVALEHLAVDGSALSLRAVARDMGMVSSALYRYFPSRDELLTALIIDAYDGLGLAAEEADAASAAREDFAGRWLAVGHAIRAWAVAKPHEYALIYGSPIPGYAAPVDTVGPANRPVVVLARIVAEAAAAGRCSAVDASAGGLPSPADSLAPALAADLTQISDFLATGTDHPTTARFLAALTQLFGALSFELFGRLNNVFSDYAAWYDWQLRSMASYLGLLEESA